MPHGHSEDDPHMTFMFQDQFKDFRVNVIPPTDAEDASLEAWAVQFEGPLAMGGRGVVSFVATPMEIHRLLLEAIAAMLGMHCHDGLAQYGIDIDVSQN